MCLYSLARVGEHVDAPLLQVAFGPLQGACKKWARTRSTGELGRKYAAALAVLKPLLYAPAADVLVLRLSIDTALDAVITDVCNTVGHFAGEAEANTMSHWGNVRQRALLATPVTALAYSAHGGAHTAVGVGAGAGAKSAVLGPASGGAGAAETSIIPGAALGGSPAQRGAAGAKLAYGDTLDEHGAPRASELFWHGKRGHATANCGVLLDRSLCHGRAASCWPVIPGATGLSESKAEAFKLQRLTAARRQ